MQVRFLSDEQKADEYARSQSRASKMPDDLAKPIGLLNGTSTNGSHKTAWLNKATFSDCVSYKLDENGNKVDAHVFRPGTTTRKPNRRKDAIDISDAMAERFEAAARLREIVGTNNIGADYS